MKRALLITTVLFLILEAVLSNPVLNSSKKEKNRVKEQELIDTKITEEEKKFVKEIEEKFNIKNDDDDDDSIKSSVKEDVDLTKPLNVPFPAVIAIEIVNDNTTDGKGKRTIDANLGYGYKTNNGYFYSQFGKKNTQNSKFMIYPYSQHDIPSANGDGSGQINYSTKTVFTNKEKGEKTFVEIQPSKAYQLVPIDSEQQQETQSSYSPSNIVSHLRTNYENVQSVETPPPPQYSHSEDIYPTGQTEQESPRVLYSTYNGGHLSGFSGNFPSVMPSYYVNPSKFLNHPQYQPIGVPSQEEEQFNHRRVIPVIILRIPSSQLQSPVAELYPKLPHSNPYATTINHVNLQALVRQYLANLQAQYITHVPQQTVSYVQQRQPAYAAPAEDERQQYSVPQHSEPQYIHPSYSSYVQPQYREEQPSQSYQYVPHPSQSSTGYVPNSQMSFSHVFNSLSHSHQAPGYETSEDGAQNLPISENYPDTDHTQVILNSRYQNGDQDQSLVNSFHTQHAEYSTSSPVVSPVHLRNHPYRYLTRSQPSVQITHQGSTYPEEVSHGSQQEEEGSYSEARGTAVASAVEESDVKQEEPSPSKEPPRVPFNYHAHLFPKRQAKPSAKENGKVSHRGRRIRSGIDTNI